MHTLGVSTGTFSLPRARAPRSHYGPGRPPKALTEHRLALILEQVAVGVPPQTAAVAAGVPAKTWRNWLSRSREAEPVEPYRSMGERLEAAVTFYHQSRVHVVHAGAEKDPRLAQWELERRFPNEWGDKSRPGGVVVNVGVLVESPEWRALSERLLLVLLPFPDALAAVVGELGGAGVVDGEAVELAELAA